MRFKAKPNYFIATFKEGFLFDDKGEFETKDKGIIKLLKSSGIEEIKEKKKTKKKS